MLVRIDPDCAVYVPNAFLPDDDGRNDFFYPGAGVCVRAVRVLRVYDRWGELVFERRDFQPNVESLGWDGRFNGKLLTPGVFVWTMELEFLDGRTKSYQGDVTLIK
jgi:gliding motility-associated-like protein